jgi:hypothetical protein
MRFKRTVLILTTPLLFLCWSAGSALAITVSATVAGSANPYLAGMPGGSTCCGGDSAPAQSPTQVLGLGITGGAHLSFTVTGSVSFSGGVPTDPPDGSFITGTSSNNGMSAITSPVDSLLGVFLGPGQPDLSVAPAALDFSPTGLGTGFSSLSPLLKQVFFIGDGLTGNGIGSAQIFIAPVGATRLFLGTDDGFGWFNNTGAFSVLISSGGSAPIPAPMSLVLLAIGLAAVSITRGRKKA